MDDDDDDDDDGDDAVNRLTFVDRHYSTCVITQEQGKNTKYAPVAKNLPINAIDIDKSEISRASI